MSEYVITKRVTRGPNKGVRLFLVVAKPKGGSKWSSGWIRTEDIGAIGSRPLLRFTLREAIYQALRHFPATIYKVPTFITPG